MHKWLLHNDKTHDVGHPADEDSGTATEEGGQIQCGHGIEAVDDRNAGKEISRIPVALGIGDTFCVQNGFEGCRTENVGNNVGNDSQVCEVFKLFGQGRADGHKR